MFQCLNSKVILKDIGIKLDTANNFILLPFRMALDCKDQNLTQLKNLLILYVCIGRMVKSLLSNFKEWIDVFQSEWLISKSIYHLTEEHSQWSDYINSLGCCTVT